MPRYNMFYPRMSPRVYELLNQIGTGAINRRKCRAGMKSVVSKLLFDGWVVVDPDAVNDLVLTDDGEDWLAHNAELRAEKEKVPLWSR